MKELSKDTKRWLDTMGGFEAIEQSGHLMMIGKTREGWKWEMSERDWLDLASACYEIAGWLEVRNIATQEKTA